MTQTAGKQSTRRRGRPTAEQSRRLDEKIKSVALNLFLDHGFDAVTMESIAREVGIHKNTLYARYSDKSKLFAEAWTNSRLEWTFQETDEPPPKGVSLENSLLALAEVLLDQALNPRVLKLDRIAVAQAQNFPREIVHAFDISVSPRIRYIANVLRQHEDAIEQRSIAEIEITAECFLGAVTGVAAKMASMGVRRSREYEHDRLRRTVAIFLHGILKK